VSEGVNNHYWESKISELLRSLKKVHYLVCFNKIETLELDLNAYSWKGGGPLFSFITALGGKC
jgi:hypothetical protein